MNRISIEEYAQQVEFTIEDLKGTRGNLQIVLARETYWYYLYNKEYMKLKDIATMFNRKYHSSILSGINTVQDLIDTKDEVIEKYINLIGIFFHQATDG